MTEDRQVEEDFLNDTFREEDIVGLRLLGMNVFYEGFQNFKTSIVLD